MSKRLLLKLSGEVISGDKNFGISPKVLNRIVSEIVQLKKQNYEIAVVIGGGNIYRGSKLIKEMNFPDYKSHHMGMIGTVINGLALETAIRKKGVKAQNYSAFTVEGITSRFDVEKARDRIGDTVLIFTGGTGNPFFSTDSAAALRAAEIEADLLLKATKVDGVYSEDPEKNPEAEFFKNISYSEYIRRDLQVMDSSSVLICKENQIPIYVFNINKKNNLNLVLNDNTHYTLIN
ncbi:MAG: UMP kinase [Candidatus Mcinerneyibacterium aminivorans]|jgi:uridylate kinase|uniref:Uridylate kinase n=1 Tax=Candidatus Mcinerneyibacterium aminivorans TaxID=2703815 RepID=A0A5D0MA57_9BACT|nr:MAG: UMP kinase [Candidatus Mcinerneyibacterium aminivorans]